MLRQGGWLVVRSGTSALATNSREDRVTASKTNRLRGVYGHAKFKEVANHLLAQFYP